MEYFKLLKDVTFGLLACDFESVGEDLGTVNHSISEHFMKGE